MLGSRKFFDILGKQDDSKSYRIKNYSNVVFSLDGEVTSSKIITIIVVIAKMPLKTIFKAIKGVWWMPRRQEAKKDVVSCDKLRGAAHEH